MPALREVVETLAPTGMTLQIELKGEGTERPAAEIVAGADMVHRVRFTSFFHMRVFAVREILPEAATGVLMNSNPVAPLEILEASRADSLHVKWERLDERLVREVHGGGKMVIAMGRIVEPEVIDRLIDLGVDVIGSDRPDVVIERLRSRGLCRGSSRE